MHVTLRPAVGLLLVALGAGEARAQAGEQLTVIPDANAFACLNSGDRKQPTYPEREAALKSGAVVRVSLTFVAPDRPPKVEATFKSGEDVFVDAVKDFVKSYRLPCMAPGAPPLVGTQEFRFVPDDGRKVIYGAVGDKHPKEAEAVRCVTGVEPPRYPGTSTRRPPEGTVVVTLKFVDGTSPPQPTVLVDGGSASLAASVLDAVERYRMPCLSAADPPLTVRQLFTFVLAGSTRYVLKDAGLRQFLAAVDKPAEKPVRFDFSTMGCPFDVRLRLFQPYLANDVGELEHSDPNRRELIEWLRSLSLKLPREQVRQVIGQSMTISVPCGTLDLT